MTYIAEHEKAFFIAKIEFDAEHKISQLYIQPPLLKPARTNTSNPYAPVSSNLFTEEAVVIKADDGQELDGLMTIPKNTINTPAVILISGSGPQDLNKTIYENKPFMDIAHGLASRGIAVLRYHKRSFVHAANPPANRTVDDLRTEYMNDLDAAIKMLKNDTRFTSIFVLGHSLGGSLIPAVSLQHPELAGVISVAGSMRSLPTIAIDQLQTQIDQIHASHNIQTNPHAEAQLRQWIDELKTAQKIPTDMPDDKMLWLAPVKYWRSLEQAVNPDLVPQMNMPFFIVQGDADFQSSSELDYGLWLKIACPREHVTCKLYPNLSHLMTPSVTGNLMDYKLPFHVSDEFIDDLTSFVKNR